MYYAIICGESVVCYAHAYGRKSAAWKARRNGFKHFRVARSTRSSYDAWVKFNGTFRILY